ncbi:hypothetical protein C2G38_2034941 [Gigaspora rosea]|uniref:Uncharacterized protein n=1 Tax=Gigaspora rosea TaxID=44941 RepID=A0A397VIF2_9GLOM|nr:hypothetical protein C2G38_2034941 [Gigaspora rosea]
MLHEKTLEAYPYLENTFALSVDMLTKALYFQQHRECTGLELDLLQHLSTAYSTAHPPHPELCDSCGHLLVNNNSTVFAYGHSYHIDYYCGKCTHCEEFYKKGIFKNVRKFLTQIKKGEDKLTKEDIDDDENDVESQEEKSEDVEELDLSSKLIAEINQIENC